MEFHSEDSRRLDHALLVLALVLRIAAAQVLGIVALAGTEVAVADIEVQAELDLAWQRSCVVP